MVTCLCSCIGYIMQTMLISGGVFRLLISLVVHVEDETGVDTFTLNLLTFVCRKLVLKTFGICGFCRYFSELHRRATFSALGWSPPSRKLNVKGERWEWPPAESSFLLGYCGFCCLDWGFQPVSRGQDSCPQRKLCTKKEVSVTVLTLGLNFWTYNDNFPHRSDCR